MNEDIDEIPHCHICYSTSVDTEYVCDECGNYYCDACSCTYDIHQQCDSNLCYECSGQRRRERLTKEKIEENEAILKQIIRNNKINKILNEDK